LVAKYQIPVLYLLGENTDFNKFNALNTGLKVNFPKLMTDEAQINVNSDFNYFEIEPELKELIESAPPLSFVFGDYISDIDISALGYQKINNIKTNKPFMIFADKQANKTAVITGKGLWKMRISDYVKNSNNELFNSFINKICSYLALKEKKELFNVEVPGIINETDNLLVKAQLYNETFELINSPDVSFEIINEDKKSFPFVFSRNSKAYQLNAGVLPIGNYKYNAKVNFGKHSFSKSGTFIVQPVNIEAVNTVADYRVLNSLSSVTGACVFDAKDFGALKDSILANNKIKPVIINEESIDELINLKYLFFLVLLLLSVEWFFRKYFGAL